MGRDKEQSLSLQSTIDDLNKRYLNSETKCQEMQFTLDCKEVIIANIIRNDTICCPLGVKLLSK